MVPARMSLTTLICVVLLLLHRSTATANKGAPGDKPERGPPLQTDISDIILLSFDKSWKETHSIFARWIRRPITTWSVQKEAFTDNYITAIKGSKKPVFFIVETRKNPSKREILRVKWFTCSLPYLVAVKPDIHDLLNSRLSKTLGSEYKAGYFTVNETSMHSFFWPPNFSTDQKPGSKSTSGKLAQFDGYRVQSLTGSTLRVTCVNISHHKATEQTCSDTSVIQLVTYLKRRNVTVEVVGDRGFPWPIMRLMRNHSDIALLFHPLDDILSFSFEFPVYFITQGTFYSRVDPHRVVSLLEVAAESLNVVATTVVLLALVVLASVVIGNKHWSFFKDISDTTLFLLAAVLATSAVQPTIRGHACFARKALIGLWLVSLLPLSVYFRTELTAIVTLRRPAYRIDTLQKLEDALDKRLVAPCVVRFTLSHEELMPHYSHLPQQSLLKKLQFEFARQDAKELVTDNLPDCLQCASRRDRVCYIGPWRPPSRSLLKRKSVAPFAQHLKMQIGAFYMRKSHRLYRPLRRFYQSMEEHKLIHSNEKEPEYGTGETEIDMRGLLVLLGILHATSCLLLVLEVVVARYMRSV